MHSILRAGVLLVLLSCTGRTSGTPPAEKPRDAGEEGSVDGAQSSRATLSLTSPSAFTQVAGKVWIVWEQLNLGGSEPVRLSAWVEGKVEPARCVSVTAAASEGRALFDFEKCVPVFAPGETVVVRAEASSASAELKLKVTGATRGVLYAPNPVTNPDDNTHYPHAIQLAHSGEWNGTILATFERQHEKSTQPGRGWLFFRSRDGGATFQPLGVPLEPVNFPNTKITWMPTLFEVAQDVGSSPAGTILFAGNTIEGGRDAIQVFRSFDHGETWTFLSTLEEGNDAISPVRPWEAHFIQLDDRSIVAYFSDERTPVASQSIAYRRSRDGGATWGPKVQVWQNTTYSDRPGMATVVRMGDGRYAMAVELCGGPGDYCRTWMKLSNDGLTFGSGAADPGFRVQAANGHIYGGNPYLTWIPGGGPKGTLILSAQWSTVNAAQLNTAPGNAGQTLLVNDNGGSGPWYELTAPLRVNFGPTNTGAGYRNAVLPLSDGKNILFLAASYTGPGVINAQVYATANAGVLPYRAPFAGEVDTGWQTFGGTWSVANGAYVNSSGGAGEKAIVGSTGWANVSVETELKLDGQGNAGVLLRVDDPGVGVDEHNGYYAGISSLDGMAFIGRQQRNWAVLGTPAPVPGGVAPGQWYRLKATAAGCTFTLTVTSPSGAAETLTRTDPGCALHGAAGVRTFLTPASWRDFRVGAP